MANVQSDTVGRKLLVEVLPCVSPREVLGEGRGPTCTTGEPRKPCKRRKGGEYIFLIYAWQQVLWYTQIQHTRLQDDRNKRGRLIRHNPIITSQMH